MAEEYKNASDDFKNVPEHETPKIETTEESSAPTGEVKERGGLFDFFKKKEEVKPQETTPTPLESEFEHKAQISEPAPSVAKHEVDEDKEHKPEHKPTLLEQIHQKHEEEEENKPGLLHKLHRSNSFSSSSSEEEGEDGEKRKKNKEKKKIFGGEQKTEEETKEDRKDLMEQIKEKFPHGTKNEEEVSVISTAPEVTAEPELEHPEEKKGVREKIKEKLPGHSKKPEDSPIVNTTAAVPVTEEHPAEKKGILEKIKEKLPGHHAKSTAEEEKKSNY